MTNADDYQDMTAVETIERDAYQDFFAAAPPEVVRDLRPAFRRIAGMGVIGCAAAPITELNRAMAVGVTRADTEVDLDEAAAWLEAHATAWAFQAAPGAEGSPAPAWLRARSLVPSGNGWARFKLRVPSAGDLETSGFDVHAAEPATAEAFGETIRSGFGMPPAMVAWFAALVGRPGWRTYLAFDGREPAAACMMFSQGDMAWFGIDATRPAHRRRGAQQALIARRVADARSAGVTLCTAETGHPGSGDTAPYSSLRNYLRAGFSLAYIRPNYKPA